MGPKTQSTTSPRFPGSYDHASRASYAKIILHMLNLLNPASQVEAIMNSGKVQNCCEHGKQTGGTINECSSSSAQTQLIG